MKKIDSEILSGTKYIATWVIIFSVLMESVFLVINQWNYTVLLGNLLGASVAVLNFFLMGLTVQSALKKEEKDAKATMRASQLYRYLMVLAVTVVGILLPVFSNWTVIIPIFFPRVAIFIRPFVCKNKA